MPARPAFSGSRPGRFIWVTARGSASIRLARLMISKPAMLVTPIGPRPTLRNGMCEDTEPAGGIHPVNDLLRVARAPFEAAGQIEGAR